MADIVPEYAAVIDSRQLSEMVRRAQRDLPWRRPGVTPWQIRGQRVHASADARGAGRTDLAGLGGALATPIATAAASAADVLRAGASSATRAGEAAARMRACIAASTATWCRRTSKPCCRCRESAPTPRVPIACFAYRQRVPVVDTNVRAWSHGPCTAGPTLRLSSPRDLDDVDALLPNDDEAPRFSVALMELGRRCAPRGRRAAVSAR
jgi:A/G-specific adenine glycosylase